MASLLEPSTVRCPFCANKEGRLLQKEPKGSEVLQTFHCATCTRTWETNAKPFFVEVSMPVPSRASCPACHSAEGYLRGMTTGKGAGSGWFTFVCNDCRHSWKRVMRPDIQPPDTANDVTITAKARRLQSTRDARGSRKEN
jgi:DNA-directed RNA polymerase subunit M/transcription elongation factor TFIIS